MSAGRHALAGEHSTTDRSTGRSPPHRRRTRHRMAGNGVSDLNSTEESIAGSLLGLAVGDALGAAVEGRGGDEVVFILTGGGEDDDPRLGEDEVPRNVKNATHSSLLRPTIAMDHFDQRWADAACEARERSGGEAGDHEGLWHFRRTAYGPRGIYTDDTQYCLCGLQPIYETGRFDPERAAQVFARLRRSKGAITSQSFGLFRGTGQSGRKAISRMAQGEDWRNTGQFTAGNGAAMRTGPLGAYYHRDMDELIRKTIECCLLTTRDPRGVAAGLSIAIACAYFVQRAASNGLRKTKPPRREDGEYSEEEHTDDSDEEDVEDDFDPKALIQFIAKHCRDGEEMLLRDYGPYLLFPVSEGRHPKKDARQRHAGKRKKEDGRERRKQEDRSPDLDSIHQFSSAVKGLSGLINRSLDRAGSDIMQRAQRLSSRKVTHPCQGFAFCSVLMSILAVTSASNYEEALVAGISMGGDCDTVGAMVGTMSGARWGLSSIPQRWRRDVANAEALYSRAAHLGMLATGKISVHQLEKIDEEEEDDDDDQEPSQEERSEEEDSEGEAEEEPRQDDQRIKRASTSCCCELHTLAELVETERNPVCLCD